MVKKTPSTPRKEDGIRTNPENTADPKFNTPEKKPPESNDDSPKRMTVVLPPETAKMLEILCELQSISMNEAIRRAISTEAFIQTEIRNKSKILIETEEGGTKELIFR